MESIPKLRAEAAQLLFGWRNTAVVDAAATLLATAGDVDSLGLLCKALAEADDVEIQDHILWVLSPLWKSGQLDLPPLLRQVSERFSGKERMGAQEAAEWLGIDLSHS